MHIQLLRNIKLTVGLGTFAAGDIHHAGAIGEVPDERGKTMVHCGEAVELVEQVEYETVPEVTDGPPDRKTGEPTKVTVMTKVPKSRSWVPKPAVQPPAEE